MIKKVLTGLAMVFMLSSCMVGADTGSTVTQIDLGDGVVQTTTTNVNNSDVHSYFEASGKHSEAESKRVSSMVEKVMGSSNCEDCTDEGKAWSGAFKVMAIAFGDNFKPTEYKGSRPLNGYDVMDGAVGDVVDITNRLLNPFGFVGSGGSGGGNLIKATDSGVVNVDMSNTSESHNVPTAYDNSYNTHNQDWESTANSNNNQLTE